MERATQNRKASNFLVMHGCAGSTALVLRPVLDEATLDFRLRMAQNLNNLVRTSVDDNTERTYCTGVRCWLAFLVKMEILDKFLSVVPVWFTFVNWSFASSILGQFLAYLVTDNGVAYPTASGYLSAVRHYFKVNMKSLEPFLCVSLQDARKSLKLRHEAQQSSADSRRQAYTHEMLKCLETSVCSRFDAKGFCIIVAAHLAVTLILRCSEYLYSLEQHFIRGQDVIFELVDPATGVVSIIASSEAYLFDHLELRTTYVYLRDAKNDQEGKGNGYGFTPSPVTATNVFDIATELFDCAKRCRPHLKAPFFSCTHGPSTFVLHYKPFKAALKRAAVILAGTGADAKIGTHSLRILGVALQHAAHVTDLDIMTYMRSKSLSFLRYIRLSMSTIQGYKSAAANPFLYTDADIRMLRMTSSSAA